MSVDGRRDFCVDECFCGKRDVRDFNITSMKSRQFIHSFTQSVFISFALSILYYLTSCYFILLRWTLKLLFCIIFFLITLAIINKKYLKREFFLIFVSFRFSYLLHFTSLESNIYSSSTTLQSLQAFLFYYIHRFNDCFWNYNINELLIQIYLFISFFSFLYHKHF